MSSKNNGLKEETNVQKAIANANIEITHLQKNVQSLRDELEKQKIQEETNVQKAIANANIEITHLQDNVQSLRHELEKNNKFKKKPMFKKPLRMPILKLTTYRITFNH